MSKQHFSSTFNFLTLPITLAWVSCVRPKTLSQLSVGEIGVSYSLVAAFWSILIRYFFEKSYAREENLPTLASVLDVVLAIPFAVEILTIPTLFLYLTLFFIPAFLIFRNPEERRDVISFTLILFFVVTLPFTVLSRTALFPSAFQFEVASWRTLFEGHIGVWVYLLLPICIALVLYPLNIGKLTPSSNSISRVLYFFLIVFFVVFFAWEVEPTLDVISLSLLYHAANCESFGCFVHEVRGIYVFYLG